MFNVLLLAGNGRKSAFLGCFRSFARVFGIFVHRFCPLFVKQQVIIR